MIVLLRGGWIVMYRGPLPPAQAKT